MTRRRVLWVTLTLMGIGLVVAALVAVLVAATTVTSVRADQLTNAKKADASRETLRRINDCTTPGRKCFDEGQRRSASVVAALNQGSAAAAAAAAACADRPGISGYRMIKACVDATLADQNTKGKP